MANSQTFAALDLGSNSFHMVIADQDSQGNLQFIDRVKEMVRLNAGLDDNRYLTEESQQRAVECLHRFSQRLRDIPASHIRAVGTNTFRSARNAKAFLARAEAALGQHISIISGQEEARLVYLGAAMSLHSSGKQRLVVDIGGGSTEFIIGHGFDTITMNSLHIGCVSMSRWFFPDGKITTKRLRRARDAVMLELEPILSHYQNIGWQESVGTSGTIRATDDLSRSLGLAQDWLSTESFEVIDEWLCAQGNSERLDFITDRRKPVFSGGYAIISAVFKAFGIERLESATGALREGVLYDLNGRFHNHDSRDSGIDVIVDRFGLDRAQSTRMIATCEALLKQVETDWQLEQVIHYKLLRWACLLHEVGIGIAFRHYHKHGAYMIENADISGFSRQQQRLLALLVRSHRQHFPLELFESFPKSERKYVLRLAILLRISFALNRGRTDTRLPEIVLHTIGDKKKSLNIKIDAAWYDDHPLTRMDLELEQKQLAAIGFKLLMD